MKPKATSARKHEQVKPLRHSQAPRDSDLDDQRMQSFPAIEIDILRGVNQVETCHPADHAKTQDQGR